MHIPSLLLKQLYTFGTLKNTERGVKFSIKNRLSDATLTRIRSICIDGEEIPSTSISIACGDRQEVSPNDISSNQPIDFPLRKTIDILCAINELPQGKHHIEIVFETEPFGRLKLKVDDSISEEDEQIVRIPRDPEDDYNPKIIQKRQKFVEDFTGRKMKGFVFVEPEGTDLDEDLDRWVEMCLDFNPRAKSSKK